MELAAAHVAVRDWRSSLLPCLAVLAVGGAYVSNARQILAGEEILGCLRWHALFLRWHERVVVTVELAGSHCQMMAVPHRRPVLALRNMSEKLRSWNVTRNAKGALDAALAGNR